MLRLSKEKINDFLERNACRVTNSKLILGPKDQIYDTATLKSKIVNENIHRENPQDIEYFSKETPLDQLARERQKAVSLKLSTLEHVVPSEYSLSYMSPEEMKGSSILTVTSMSTTNEVGTFGLFDKRLAPEKRKICLTCSRNYKGCEQHRAYIPLHKPVINPSAHEEVIYYCECCCWDCGQVYANEDFIKMAGLDKITDRKKYLKALADFTPQIHTLHCHPGYRREIFERQMKNHVLLFEIEGEPGKKYSKMVENIIRLFDNLNEQSLKILRVTGENHPRNLILHGILALPPNLHLPTLINGKLTEHLYTTKYVNIIDCNIRMSQTRDDVLLNDLQATQYARLKEIFFGPDAASIVKVSDKDIGIYKGFSRKEGIIRKYVQGKRVDNCGRTIANPSDGKYGWVGIPRHMADTLTVKVKATKYNMAEIQVGIRNGTYKNFFPLEDGTPIFKVFNDKLRKTYIVEIGCEYERNIKDGDIILWGRQPSLHAASITGGRAYLHDDRVIKIHLSSVGPKNCDFDGDELTIHIPQTIGGQVETDTIASEQFHLMNEQSNRPMYGLAFHALLSGFLMTKTWKRDGHEHEVEIPQRRFLEALSIIENSHRKTTLIRRCIRHNVKTNSGRALISLAFPSNFTYNKDGIVIIDGILVKGVLNKDTLGTGPKSLVGVICKLFSMEEANRFIDEFAMLGDWFIMWHGFSLGQHTFATNRKKIHKKISNDINAIQARFFNLGPRPKDEIDLFFWNRKAHGMLNEGQKNGKEIGNKELAENNELNILGSNGAKAKGSDMNTAQITGCLGLQNIKGDLQKKELNNGTRGLPMFLPGDCSLESIGFITTSFYDGIDETALYDHLSSSREGMVDTAHNTKDVGYTHRRIIKGMENTLFGSRGMIETVLGKIFQFTYDCLNVALEVNIYTPELGKHLSFVDFKAQADLINRLYEYIDENGDNIPEELLKI